MLKEFLTFGYFDLEGLMLRDIFIRLMLKESFNLSLFGGSDVKGSFS